MTLLATVLTLLATVLTLLAALLALLTTMLALLAALLTTFILFSCHCLFLLLLQRGAAPVLLPVQRTLWMRLN